MREGVEFREQEKKDPIQSFIENEIKPYLDMIEDARTKIEEIDKEEKLSGPVKDYNKKIYSDHISAIEQKIQETKTAIPEIIDHFKSIDSQERENISKMSEDIIGDLKEEMKKLEHEGKKDSYAYVWKGGMLWDYESQLRMLKSIEKGEL